VTAIEPGDRVRVAHGVHRKSMEGSAGIVLVIDGDGTVVQPDGCGFTTIDPDLADLELIAKGNGDAPAAGYIVGWAK
jgi:hypothetical protein